MPIPDPPLRFQPLPNETGRDSVNGRLDSATSTAMPERRATTAQRGPSKIESLRKATILMLTPEKRIGEPPGSIAGLKAIIPLIMAKSPPRIYSNISEYFNSFPFAKCEF